MSGRVLFVSEHDLERAENLRAVYEAYDGPKRFSRGIRHMESAPRDGYAAVVCDSLPVYMPNKGDCKSIVIGHGINGDKKYALDEKRAGIDKLALLQIDYAVNQSTQTAEIMARQFGIPLERVVNLGMPRTDAFFGKSKGDGGTPLGRFKRAYFYAPTYRDQLNGKRLPRINWQKLDKMLADDEAIVVKRHYFQRKPVTGGRLRRIAEVEPHMASTPFVVDCDVLLTDYSSIVFDAYVAGKPSVLTVDDMESYLSTRGMNLDYPREYGSRWLRAERNEVGLLATLREAAHTGMTDVEHGIRRRVADMCDGHSTERVCELIRSIACGC